MSLLQTITLSHTPSSHSVHVALYRNVKNSAFLEQQLLGGNSDYEYAFIDARVILSKVHVFASCFRAIVDQLSDKLRTRNVHSEIVFALSPNNNIRTAFRNFGITANTSSLLVIKIGDLTQSLSIRSHLEKVIEGDEIGFCDSALADIIDWSLVGRLYKLGNTRQDEGGNRKWQWEAEVDRKEAEMRVLSSIALRGMTN
ncbi:BgTH12-00735 [Blumeria graminis f. sp. triticale]|uniref:EKC/KEOPS complex subunit CGI121 n=3 Tax=Blumeria graminis TaxID=34373 RepID=A0A381LE27_BLUGR|nr:hypothetical protein BGT96224_3480 [Blumeria graminis f. sp. tritici 96224]CAD6505243.1 BgTH12-00735 [Blumeria graminis f. sp. triticale]VDB93254.1 Bgt-3480 [Blumeria graminis f. sp. tritici]